MTRESDSIVSSPAHGEGHHLCWSCREEIGKGPFCLSCVKIQRLGEQENYFSIFGLEIKYNVDQKRLKESFYELSKKLHPDFFTTASETERLYARDNSAIINKGLETLSDPIKRADYLLGLEKGNISSNPTPPQELFEEILEAGELLAEPIESGSTAMGALKEIDQKFDAYNHTLLESLSNLFEQTHDSDDKIRSEIEACLDNIKYLRTITTRVKAKLDEVR